MKQGGEGMMRRDGPVVRSGIAAFLLVILAGCAGVSYLKTGAVDPAVITGTYTLLLHGGRYGDDMQNVAILDIEGDGYEFELYAPEFDYKVKRNVPAGEAVEEAERLVRSHYAFLRSQWLKILDSGGRIIGYEARPLYDPLHAGYPDILDITYVIRDHKVMVRIQFKPDMERAVTGERDFPVFRRMK